jgi:Protein of unknown function (DUF1638)
VSQMSLHNNQADVGVIACGAIAKELLVIFELNGWQSIKLYCLPATLHNSPQQIPQAIVNKVADIRDRHRQLFIAYGDCGTAGLLDAELDKLGLSRLPGAHCYEFFSGSEAFTSMADEEPGTFFLTDFLVRHFERLVIKGLGLDRYPQLLNRYFGNYRRLLFISQSGCGELQRQAKQHADKIGLAYEYQHTGFLPLQRSFEQSDIIQRMG